MSRATNKQIAAARAYLHAAAEQVEGSSFAIVPLAKVADKDHLWVDGRIPAFRLGPNIVTTSGTFYPHDGVDALVAAIRAALEVPCAA